MTKHDKLLNDGLLCFSHNSTSWRASRTPVPPRKMPTSKRTWDNEAPAPAFLTLVTGTARLVPWESFRADIEVVVLTPDEMKKSSAGRKAVDAIVMFRMLVLQALHNLSDEQAEYQVRDRFSFTRFLRLGIEDGIPDATTLWLFREKLAKAGLIEKLFDRFDQHLAAKG